MAVDAGAWVLPHAVFDAMDAHPGEGELRILPAISKLIENGEPFRAYTIEQPWLQFGDHSGIAGVLEVMSYFQSMAEKDKHRRPDPKQAVDSGNDCIIERSDVQTKVEHCEIRDALVFGSGRLRNCTVENAVVMCRDNVSDCCISNEIRVF